MPEIKIKIDLTTHEKLKQLAKEDDRSLTKYIERGLKYLANLPNGYHTQSTNQFATALPFPTEIKAITYEKTKPPKPTPTTTQEQKQKKKAKLYAYFKKKFKSVYSSYMPTSDTLPACFRPAAMDYLLIKYNDEMAIDNFIDTQLEYINFEDPEYDFYIYESEIEKREQKLIIPYTQNHIYNQVKEYVLAHSHDDYSSSIPSLSEALYHMIEYPTSIYDNLVYFSEPLTHDPHSSFFYECFSDFDSIPPEDFVRAFIWKDEENN